MNKSIYNNCYSFYNNRLKCLTKLTSITKDLVYFENSLFRENITSSEHDYIVNKLKDLTYEYRDHYNNCEAFLK